MPHRTSVVYNKASSPELIKEVMSENVLNVCIVSSNIKKKGMNDFFEVASLCKLNNGIHFNLYGPITDEVKKAQKELDTKNIKIWVCFGRECCDAAKPRCAFTVLV